MTKFIRYQDWEDRLRTYLDRVEWERFKWGTHDCALFAADCIKAQTGVDFAVDVRGKYDTAIGAARVLREQGAGTLLKTLKAWLGPSSCIHHAKRGDIVMLNATTLGVCVGQYSYFVGQEQGFERLAVVPTASCRYCFHVPFEARA